MIVLNVHSQNVRNITQLCLLLVLPLLWCIQLFGFFKSCKKYTAAQRNPGHPRLPPLYCKEVRLSPQDSVSMMLTASYNGPRSSRVLLEELHHGRQSV